MILTDVKVPVLGKQYNFRLNEKETVGNIVEELVEMICRKEQCRLHGEAAKLSLWSQDLKRWLPNTATLEQCGVRTASSLMLL